MDTPTSLILGGSGPTLFANADTISPITPSSTSSLAFCTAGLNLSTCPVARITPASLAAAIISSASCNVNAIGFSTKTCFPCLIASITTAWWNVVGTHTLTASISGFSSNALYSVYPLAPYFFSIFLSAFSLTSLTAIKFASSIL